MHNRFAAAVTAARIAMAAALAILLAGCVIASKAPLVDDAEGVDLLPASFYMFGYEDDEAGRKPSSEDPQAFTREGHTYVSADKSMSVRFVPLAGAPDTYLLAAVGPDGSVYGVARYRGDGILAIDMVLQASDPTPLIEAEMAAGGIDPRANLTVEDGGITVGDRATLDSLVAMHLAGRLPMEDLVAYIADAPDAKTPARIVPDGDFWKAE